MATTTLSDLAGPLLALGGAIWPHVRRVRGERRAARMPFGGENDLLKKGLDETLDRLCQGNVDDAWWRNVLDRLEQKYVAPDFLRKPALQEWLADNQVQADFKALARARIMGAEADDPNVLGRLRHAYADSTGEHEQLAKGPIIVTAAILAAGYLASMGPEQQALAGMVQAAAQETRAGFEGVDEQFDALRHQVGPDQALVEEIDRIAKEQLSLIQKRRSVVPDRSRQEISVLAQRVMTGSLRHASPAVRGEVLYWAARLHAVVAETLANAKTYREQLRQVHPEADTRIVDALVLEAEGNVDDALLTLRDADDPDAHAAVFTTLVRNGGSDAALAWFDEQPGRDDPDFLTGIGWSNVAIWLAQAGRWDEAVERLAIAQGHIGDWPDLAFVEGVVNAAMLLPVEHRRLALQMNLFYPWIRTIEGADADRYRAHAHECFDRASPLLAEVDLGERARAAEDWRLWLRLTDPRPEVAATARREIQEGMKDGRRAVDLVRFALAHDIEFEPGPLERYLAQRSRLGGLEGRELMAELMLAWATMAPRERAEFLKREEDRLVLVVSKAMLAGMRTEALVEDGQTERARRLLDENKDILVDFDYERLRAMIDAGEGSDPRPQLEMLFQETRSLIDLQNLVNHLGRVGDWGALRPLLQDLFGRERTTTNAHRLIRCMRSDPSTSESDIVAFLEENDDLVEHSLDLTSTRAWALLHVGRLPEAKNINDALLARRNDASDLMVDINLALQAGDWERFPAIIDREWPRRNSHGPETLLRLASLAAETDTTAGRALELARLAAEKAPDDPQVLVSAFGLFVQLGHDKQANPSWFSRAAELSSDKGPVWRADLRTVIEEMMPAHRERTRTVERALLRGEAPLQLGAAALNTRLSRFLVDFPQHNATCQDGRQRVMLPTISGARQPVEMEAEWTVGVDATSVMVLHHLGLLRGALGAFRRVVLPPDMMILLLNERRQSRFHQPSRVKDAEEVRDLIDQDLLKPAQSLAEPPGWLAEEVGRDLAEMLQAAQEYGGRVVCPRPIHRLRSFAEEEADLREYGGLTLSTTAFAHALHEGGHLDAEAYGRASEYLAARDHEKDVAPDPTVLNRPLYLDDLAVTYLQGAGLLQAACRRGFDLRAHPSMRTEQDALIAANREGDKVADTLNEIRVTLRDALDSGEAAFLPRQEPDQEEGAEAFFREAPTLAHFVVDTRPCDAVCVDDRFINRHMVLTDRAQRSVPTVCVLDVLRHLEARGLIDRDEALAALHRLRGAGFAMVPVGPDELEARLRAAQFDQDGVMIETAELRVLRQTLMRLRSLDMVQQPLEVPFLDQLRLASVLTIRRLWKDESVPPERAIAFSDWVWHNVAPSPLDWSRTAPETERMMPLPDMFARHVELLLKPMPMTGDRDEAFRSWVESAVLEPLLPANTDLVDALAGYVRAEIERMIEEFAEDAPHPDS